MPFSYTLGWYFVKTVLITGASRGIGAEIARAFYKDKNNYNIIINYNKSKKEAKKLADEIDGFAVKADIGSTLEVSDMFDKIEQRYGGVDILVNNAGISQFNMFMDISEEEWLEMININLNGAYRTTQYAIGNMIGKHNGCIINISSMWGVVGSSCEVAYSTAKAGLIGMTKALAKELGLSNIRVNCIAPGVIDTDMNSELDNETFDGLIEMTPLMRLGKPSDIAKCACFLAGEGGEFITGQVIGVNGGFVI